MSPVRSRTALISALLALVFVAPVLAAPIPAVPTLVDDFKYLPTVSNFLLHIRMDQFLASEGFKKLSKQLPAFDKSFIQRFRKDMGFDISNVERLSMSAHFSEGRPVYVFHLKNAVKPDVLTKASADMNMDVSYTEEKVGDYTLHVPNKHFLDAFCLVDDKTLLYGQAKDLQKVLERNKKPDHSAELRAALAEADLRATLTLLLDVKSLAVGKPPMILGVGPSKVIDNVSAVALSLDFGKEGYLRFVGVCKDAKVAEEVKTQAERAVRTIVSVMLKTTPPAKLPKGFFDWVDQLKIETKDHRAVTTLKGDDAVAFATSVVHWLMNPIEVNPPDTKPIVEVVPPGEKKP